MCPICPFVAAPTSEIVNDLNGYKHKIISDVNFQSKSLQNEEKKFLALFEKQKTLKKFFDFGLVFFISIMADVSARSS